jgi:RsiW-degrading membrane proteinase PrsW (M82 family)
MPELTARMTTLTWRAILARGLVLWAVSAATLALTHDVILLPCVVLVGSFLVPVTAVFWLLERRDRTELDPARLLAAFFVAGVLALMVAAGLEVWLLPHVAVPDLWVGLIEEATKAVGIVLVARGLRHYSVRDGVVLGATVGLGFGAFESCGYALRSGFPHGTLSMSELIGEQLLRAGIAPFCHGVWSGLLGAVIFAAARVRGLRAAPGIAGTYLGAALLHALWDASSTTGVIVTVLLTGDASQRQEIAQWAPPDPAALQPQALITVVQWVVMVMVAIVGLLLLRSRWRAAPLPTARVPVPRHLRPRTATRSTD